MVGIFEFDLIKAFFKDKLSDRLSLHFLLPTSLDKRCH